MISFLNNDFELKFNQKSMYMRIYINKQIVSYIII
jgi:hypothetical protein